jgi:hypothetical protein
MIAVPGNFAHPTPYRHHGKGHITRTVGTEDRVTLRVPLSE